MVSSILTLSFGVDFSCLEIKQSDPEHPNHKSLEFPEKNEMWKKKHWNLLEL